MAFDGQGLGWLEGQRERRRHVWLLQAYAQWIIRDQEVAFRTVSTVGCVPEQLADGAFESKFGSSVHPDKSSSGLQRVELKERVERCRQVLVEHEVGSSGQCRLALVVL